MKNLWTLGYLYSLSIISSQSLNLEGRRGTTDDVATIPFNPFLSSVALRESPNTIPVHSLMLSSHLFFCLPLLLAPFTVPCRIVWSVQVYTFRFWRCCCSWLILEPQHDKTITMTCVPSEDSDLMSLRWPHRPFCWFRHIAAQLS